jgi:hypothetical protein
VLTLAVGVLLPVGGGLPPAGGALPLVGVALVGEVLLVLIIE